MFQQIWQAGLAHKQVPEEQDQDHRSCLPEIITYIQSLDSLLFDTAIELHHIEYYCKCIQNPLITIS